MYPLRHVIDNRKRAQRTKKGCASAILCAALLAAGLVSAELRRPAPTSSQVQPQLSDTVKKEILSTIGKVPEINHAVFLGGDSERAPNFVSTTYAIDDFFHQDFTLTAWIMPQFPRAIVGPIFSNSSAGLFWAGFHDYSAGTDNDVPVFAIQVGKQIRKYLVRDLKPGKWAHLAVVRTNNVFRLHINGKRVYAFSKDGLEPDLIAPQGNYTMKPQGTLLFGTPPSELTLAPGSTLGEPKWQQAPNHTAKVAAAPQFPRYEFADFQYYGFIDDVGLFTIALSVPRLQNMSMASAHKRLSGFEDDLAAGWGFDTPAAAAPLPMKLRTKWTPHNIEPLPVSVDRNSQKDAGFFSNPFFVAKQSISLPLPFEIGEKWYVVQGNASGGSHSGLAAFAFDFGRVGKPAAGTQIYASLGGRIGCYRSNVTPAAGKQEQNFLEIQIRPKVWVLYMHMAPGSLNPLATGGKKDGDSGKFCFPDGEGPVIPQWGLVGKIGKAANHLHISLHDRVSDSGVTLPLSFIDYKKSSNEGATYLPVIYGYPQDEDYITRTK